MVKSSTDRGKPESAVPSEAGLLNFGCVQTRASFRLNIDNIAKLGWPSMPPKIGYDDYSKSTYNYSYL